MLRLAYICDDFGDEQTDAEKCSDEFRWSRMSNELVLAGNYLHQIDGRDIDILVIDYGGMSISGAWEAAFQQVKAARRWAEEHPTSILLIYTQYTWHIYEEIQLEFGELPNVFFNIDFINPFPKIREWLIANGKLEEEE